MHKKCIKCIKCTKMHNYAKMQMRVCILRQSLCGKLKIICGSFDPADPTFRMFVSHFPFLFEKSQTDIELLTGILDISIDYCRCIKL